MQNHSIQISSLHLSAALVLSLASISAHAQGMPAMPAAPTPGTSAAQSAPPNQAQMQQEIESLRAQVKQLQQAHDMPTEKTDKGMGMGMGMGMEKMDKGMGMGTKKGKAMSKMPKKHNATPPAAAPMKKGGMGMEDDSTEMPMPPPEAANPAPMPHM